MVESVWSPVRTQLCNAAILLSSGMDFFFRVLVTYSSNHTPSIVERTPFNKFRRNSPPGAPQLFNGCRGLLNRCRVSPSLVLWCCRAELQYGSIKCFPPQTHVLTAWGNVHNLPLTISKTGFDHFGQKAPLGLLERMFALRPVPWFQRETPLEGGCSPLRCSFLISMGETGSRLLLAWITQLKEDSVFLLRLFPGLCLLS